MAYCLDAFVGQMLLEIKTSQGNHQDHPVSICHEPGFRSGLGLLSGCLCLLLKTSFTLPGQGHSLKLVLNKDRINSCVIS